MRKFYTKSYFIFLLLSTNVSIAQNWQPVVSGWKYNYRPDNADVITNTVWIDSSGLIGTDPVFYLNRIVVHCDTCTAVLGGPNPCDSCYALKNQPQFLMRKIIQLPNGIFHFADTNSIVINTFANLNDTWLFDSVANISAQLILISVENIFGNNDSVKTILLSTNDTVKFSKNYGILQYPNLYGQNSYCQLTGIEGPDLGEQVPGFWQIFDFNVGDVFHYEGFYGDGSAIPPTTVTYDKQFTITSKNVFNDSASYDYQGTMWGYNIGTGPFNFPINGTFWFQDSSKHFSNSYNGQFMDIAFRIQATFGAPSNYPDSSFDYTEFSIDSNGVFTKSFGVKNSFYNNYLIVDLANDLLNIIDAFSSSFLTGTSYLKYKTGLGQTDYGYDFFEHAGNEQLIGYVKNGDTTGVISAVPTFESHRQFIIYPIPAKDKINIQFRVVQSGKILISDIVGRKIVEQIFNSKMVEINFFRIPEGVYILTVHTDKGIFSDKIVISKE